MRIPWSLVIAGLFITVAASPSVRAEYVDERGTIRMGSPPNPDAYVYFNGRLTSKARVMRIQAASQASEDRGDASEQSFQRDSFASGPRPQTKRSYSSDLSDPGLSTDISIPSRQTGGFTGNSGSSCFPPSGGGGMVVGGPMSGSIWPGSKGGMVIGGPMNGSILPDSKGGMIVGGPMSGSILPDSKGGMVIGGPMNGSIMPGSKGGMIIGGPMNGTILPGSQGGMVIGGPMNGSIFPDRR